MRFKIDENLPGEACASLRSAGHEAMSVLDQGMGGSPDSEVIAICTAELAVGSRSAAFARTGYGEM